MRLKEIRRLLSASNVDKERAVSSKRSYGSMQTNQCRKHWMSGSIFVR